MSPEIPPEAQQIVVAYAMTLESHVSNNRLPAAVSTLPHPKAVIQRAIRTVTFAVQHAGAPTPDVLEFLEAAYVALADYVDDDVAMFLARHFDAGRALETEAAFGREKTRTAAWHQAAETSPLVGRIGRAIADESAALRAEFKTWTRPGAQTNEPRMN